MRSLPGRTYRRPRRTLEHARDCRGAARVVAALHQHRAVHRADRTAGPRARHRLRLCFLTGLLSYAQYLTWPWLPKPVVPAWGYRLTQGIHVTTGIASIPLVLIKLWSVYPNSFRWPPIPSLKRLLERLSVAVLVSADPGAAGHRVPQPAGLAPVRLGLRGGALRPRVRGDRRRSCCTWRSSCPTSATASRTRLAAGDVLTEIPWHENPASHSNAGPQPPPVTAGDLPARGAARDRRRDRAGGDHQCRADRCPARTPGSAGRPPTEQGAAGRAGRSHRRGGRA